MNFSEDDDEEEDEFEDNLDDSCAADSDLHNSQIQEMEQLFGEECLSAHKNKIMNQKYGIEGANHYKS